jgi:hypothetical protein
MSQFTFKDKLGTEWDLSLDLASAQEIDRSDYSQVTKVEFVFLTPDRDFFAELFANKPLAAALAYTIIKTSSPEKLKSILPVDESFTDEEVQMIFVRRLNGPALRDMHRSVLEAVADFFPEMQTALSSLLKKMDKVNNRLQQEVAEMDKIAEDYLEQEMDKALAEAKSKMPELAERLRGGVSTSP